MPPPKSDQPHYAGLNSTIHADLTGLRYDQYLFDTLHADLHSSGKSVTLDKAEMVRATNEIAVSGKFQLPPPNEKISDQPGNFEFTLQAPDLIEFWAPDAETRVSEFARKRTGFIAEGFDGWPAHAQWRGHSSEGSADQAIHNRGDDRAQRCVFEDLRATMNEKDYVGANGTIALAKPFSYTGSLTADVKDLSTFEPLLRALGHPTPLAGSLNITWQGSGDAATIKNTGELKVKLEKGRFANLLGLQANIETSYTPEGLSAPTIYLRSEKMDFKRRWKPRDRGLRLTKFRSIRGRRNATGYILVAI